MTMSIDRQSVVAALAKLSPDCHYDRWYRIARAVYAALGDDGFALFDEWSSRSASKYPGTASCRAQWEYSKRLERIGPGSLFYWASHDL
jgi:hypothetical protein